MRGQDNHGIENLTYKVETVRDYDRIREEFTFYNNGNCVGTAIVVQPVVENKTYRIIDYFEIEQKYRRKGFGKAAVEKLIEYEREQGCKKLALEPWLDVVGFWFECGFGLCGDSFELWMYRDI